MECEEVPTSEDASSLSEPELNEINKTFDKVCEVCHEVAKDFTQCFGTCLKIYHKACIPDNFDKTQQKCHECVTGKCNNLYLTKVCFNFFFLGEHPCEVCAIFTEKVTKCSENNCGKYYHVECLKKNYPHKLVKEDPATIICPLHFCLTCYVEHQNDRVYRFVRKRLLKCLKCPTAYHFIDSCLAAGSVTVSSSYLICPEHLVSKTGKNVNVNWCFSCNTGIIIFFFYLISVLNLTSLNFIVF